MPTRAQPALLALAATVAAACLSLLAGWQRGGLLAERLLLTCIGVVLVVAAHLLPALCRPHGWRIRALGALLWMGCMAATCYGHAVFFVMAQQHAGEIRAAAVPVIVPAVSAPGRDLVAIASDRAGVVARLARVAERKCGEKCAAVRIEHTTLTARLAALDVESAEVTRWDLALERADAERAAAKADPVAELLTTFGVAASRVDLVAGMAFAVVLEGVACFCWFLALRPAEAPAQAVTPAREASHGLRVTPVTAASQAVAPGGNDAIKPEQTATAPTAEQAADVTRVLTAIRDGTLRGTVAEIRRYVGCSQAKAAALRKQIAQQAQASQAKTESIAGKRNL
ncbi:hypothetical protein [Paraburkholderia sp. BL21I4N1]|uniref:hypothetical protein n=1 Tax=Paraburkholderia sp. BL21I4N1 TaxID=1938801 RepID=UPI0021584F1C|nr:hypothetical protein [Paraburkholderia sp. BL21I4N1]